MKNYLLVLSLFLLWSASHWAIISYGVKGTPLYSYYGSADEQAPILGVMHMAEEKSPFAMKGHESVYYGPIFSVIAAPAVVMDVLNAYLGGFVHSAADYKLWFSFNWGSVLFLSRWAAVLAGFLGLVFAWRLLNLPSVNPKNKPWIPWLGTALLATNFYYFLYSGWLRHWIFLSAFFVLQAYFLIQIKEREKKSDWIWLVVVSAASFGIGYVSLAFQLMWAPVLLFWWRSKNIKKFKYFLIYSVCFLLSSLGIVAWNPTPYIRYVNLSGTAGLSFSPWTMPSLVYYFKIIVFNQPFLSLAFVLLLGAVFFWQKQYKSVAAWVILLGGLAHLAFFASNVHNEPRYIMPFTFAIILLTALWLGNWQAERHTRIASFAVILLCLEILWQLTSTALWTWGALKGPDDRELLSFLRNLPPGQKVLIEPWRYPIEIAQSKEIISNYSRARFGDHPLSNMLTYFSKTDPPAWSERLDNFDYLYLGKPTSGKPFEEFDYFATYNGEPLATNFFEERLTRLWFQEDLRLKYRIVKMSDLSLKK
jgi:hypothetical protein